MAETNSRFEASILEHLDAAYNLAHWLVRNEQDAQDVVQDSCIKAMRNRDSFRGIDFRPWFLAIVRNTSLSWLSRARRSPAGVASVALENSAEPAADNDTCDPQALAIRAADAKRVHQAIAELPEVWREIVVLREMEGMSYKEIGRITAIPIGTVMSRLARGRAHLQAILLRTEGMP